MGKKNLTKTLEQRNTLQRFFLQSKCYWQREDLMRVSREAGLTRQQVYKWLWDRKHAERLKVKLEFSQGSYKIPDIEFTSVLYRRYKIRIPMNKQQASVFIVHPSISQWALAVLKIQGWQLVRDDNGYHSNRRVAREFSSPVVKKEEDPDAAFEAHPQTFKQSESHLKDLESPETLKGRMISCRFQRGKIIKDEIFESES